MSLRIVNFPCPAETMPGNPMAQTLFSRLLEMRQRSFMKYYGDDVYTLSEDDAYNDYLAICEERDGDLFPIFTYKIISLSTCTKYNLDFPMFYHTRSQEDQLVHGEISAMVRENLKKGEVSYMSSVVTCPEFQTNNRRLLPEMKRLGMIGLYELINGKGEVYAIGSDKTKSWMMMVNVGFETINSEPIWIKTIGDDAFMLRFKEEPESALKCRELYPNAWAERIEIKMPSEVRRTPDLSMHS